ncbi:hypothetical protein BKA58DRAFT_121930 [Alternaria rosae]|uniref:uncharacterized protein n=1 Tax=Alternaria rosae TaxID=1187941 RepID=UPI001E8E202C|nr:uncharacterized protein BKA58DRAFT_121930 [Alternaria rosae]KAH6875445.1 hypothetical protein BKA58DRAFT_121930 [Alternaria rosae]
MYQLAVILSRFEAETLHILPLLRFFTAGASANEVHLQGFTFVFALFCAFPTGPLTDMLPLGEREHKSWSRHLCHYLGWCFFF